MAKTYEGAVNMHKLLASGASPQVEANGKSVIQKYAKGGAVMPEKGVTNLPARGGVLQPKKATGEKIATMKKGGAVPKKGFGLTIAVAVPMRKPAAAPMRKAAGRGR
jgi:hypothetical protein